MAARIKQPKPGRRTSGVAALGPVKSARNGALSLLLFVRTALTTLAVLVALVITLSETFLRLVSPAWLTDWGLEVTVYLVSWIFMLTLPALAWTDGHIRADFLRASMPSPVQQAIGFAEIVLGAAFSVVVAWHGYQAASLVFRLGQVSDSSLQFPAWIFVAAVPTGFGLAAVAFLLQFVTSRK